MEKLIDQQKNNGYSYIELIVAMALLLIITIPILPAITQAYTNHQYAVSRRQAQGQATTLALKIKTSPDNAAQILQKISTDNFTYSISIKQISGENTKHYTAGAQAPIPSSSFQTNFTHLFTDGIFVIAEVFDLNGNLAGFAIATTNYS